MFTRWSAPPKTALIIIWHPYKRSYLVFCVILSNFYSSWTKIWYVFPKVICSGANLYLGGHCLFFAADLIALINLSRHWTDIWLDRTESRWGLDQTFQAVDLLPDCRRVAFCASHCVTQIVGLACAPQQGSFVLSAPDRIFSERYDIPIVTATSIDYTFNMGAPSARPKWVWHHHRMTLVGLIRGDFSLYGLKLPLPMRDSSWSGQRFLGSCTSIWKWYRYQWLSIGWIETQWWENRLQTWEIVLSSDSVSQLHQCRSTQTPAEVLPVF